MRPGSSWLKTSDVSAQRTVLELGLVGQKRRIVTEIRNFTGGYYSRGMTSCQPENAREEDHDANFLEVWELLARANTDVIRESAFCFVTV
jgi:hypothetical protein